MYKFKFCGKEYSILNERDLIILEDQKHILGNLITLDTDEFKLDATFVKEDGDKKIFQPISESFIIKEKPTPKIPTNLSKLLKSELVSIAEELNLNTKNMTKVQLIELIKNYE